MNSQHLKKLYRRSILLFYSPENGKAAEYGYVDLLEMTGQNRFKIPTFVIEIERNLRILMGMEINSIWLKSLNISPFIRIPAICSMQPAFSPIGCDA